MEFLLVEPGSSDGMVEPFLGVSSANLLKRFETEEKQNHKKISNGNAPVNVSDMYIISLVKSILLNSSLLNPVILLYSYV